MIARSLGKKIVSMAKTFPVVSLTGPRQSGKTTLVRALFPHYAYVNFENLNDRAAAEEDPIRFLKAYAKKRSLLMRPRNCLNFSLIFKWWWMNRRRWAGSF